MSETSINNQRVRLRISDTPVDYTDAYANMLAEVDRIHSEQSLGLVWFLEHPHVYTAGVTAEMKDVLDRTRAPVLRTDRGGKVTYHGPGQRIAYLMLNLQKLHGGRPDVRLFVGQLEEWIIESLASCGIKAYTASQRVGVWVHVGGKEEKIASIGVRLRKWVSYHGVAINVAPDLDYFNGIIPCGLHDFNACSMESLGLRSPLHDVDKALKAAFERVFGYGLDNSLV